MTTFAQVAREEVGELSRRQSELEARRRDLARPSPPDISELADIAARFDDAYRTLGAGGAPAPLPSEGRFSYRRRLAGGLQQFSPEWRDSDLYRLPSEVMGDAEAAILAATAAAVADRTLGDPRTGGLREVRVANRSGREVIEWAGDPRTRLNQYMAPGMAVRSFKNPRTGARLRPGARRTIG